MTFKNAEYPLLSDDDATGGALDWPGGRGCFTVYDATFGGGTVKLQWSPDGGTTWLDVDRTDDTFVTFTDVGSGIFELPQCKIRAHVATATGVSAKAFGIDL